MDSPRDSVREKIERTKNGRPRATRPDGSYYSPDPKERHQQLVEDGKVGGKGSDLARAHGRMGGRPRNVSAQELVARKAQEHAEEIWSALTAGFNSDSAKAKRDSAMAVLDYEEKYLRRQDRIHAERDKVDKDAIIAMLVERLTSDGPAARALRERMRLRREGVIDADSYEDAQLPA
jgi:hypothetical protein